MSFFGAARHDPKPDAEAGTGLRGLWIGSAIGIPFCLVGLFNIWKSVELMLAHRPTVSSLTLGLGVVLLCVGALSCIFSQAVRRIFYDD
jgi:hypothetical protein